MGKLNQVIAVVAPKKKQAKDVETKAYHDMKKPELFSGISRTYTPREEDGDKLPPESKNVQATCGKIIEEVSKALQDMLDAVATQDWANCQARATILGLQVPVTYMLYLEKQLTDLKTFVTALPTLDPGEVWTYDENSDSYASSPSETVRTRKVTEFVVAVQPTEHHPAQVKEVSKDVVAGYWKTIKFSGAMPAKEKNEILDRLRQLQEEVVKAREEANSMEVTPVKIGQRLMDFVFGGQGRV